MKISIITVVRNNEKYIEDCVKSVVSQSYRDIEYIVIDGCSSDGTPGILDRYKAGITKLISERDNGHIYAMNKGLKLATGDVVGFLHSDDFYSHTNIIEDVMSVFKTRGVDSLYGDLVYVKKDKPDRVTRYWKAGNFRIENLAWGWMPPHPTFFVKREIYEKYGHFNTDFRISADYELMLRFLYAYRVTTHYIGEVLVRMRLGGVSNRDIRSVITKSCEDYRACKIYGIKRGFFAIMLKNVIKIPQFFMRQ
jgi:glycosyltransferase